MGRNSYDMGPGDFTGYAFQTPIFVWRVCNIATSPKFATAPSTNYRSAIYIRLPTLGALDAMFE